MDNSKIMTKTDWVIVWIVSMIPLIGQIILIYWACQSVETSPKPSRTTFARFQLIYLVVMVIFVGVVGAVILLPAYAEYKRELQQKRNHSFNETVIENYDVVNSNTVYQTKDQNVYAIVNLHS